MTDNNNFFNNPPTPPDDAQQDIEQKIKLGEEEYSQDELSELVGLGKIGREAEQKYNVKIDGVWQNLQRMINEKKDLEERLKALEQNKIQTKIETGEEFSPEEMRKQALAEADRLGLLHEGNVEKRVLGIIEGYQLLNDAREYLSSQKTDGNPEATIENLLNYMQGNNPTGTRYGSIQKAYKDMFETELKEIETKKIDSLRQPGLYTTERSSAGSKQPTLVKPNKDNLEELVKAALRGA